MSGIMVLLLMFIMYIGIPAIVIFAMVTLIKSIKKKLKESK